MKKFVKKILLNVYIKLTRIFSGSGLTKIYPLNHIYNFIRLHLKSDYIESNGHKIFLDSIDSLRLSTGGEHEFFELEIMKKEIKEGDVVFDIGANIGYYTLMFAKLVGPKGKVYAFEPDPTNFSLLEKNVKINNYKNVILINKAVGNKTGKIKLYLSEENHGMHRVYESKYCKRAVDIDIIKLDDLFNKGIKLNFIKMDIEGAEIDAIKGMSKLLNKNKPKMLTEFAPVSINEFGPNPKEYLELLKKVGFKILNINGKTKKIEELSMDQLLSLYTIKKENLTNLLCYPLISPPFKNPTSSSHTPNPQPNINILR